ncbi:MAG: VPS10 domain-containing protein [Bacteroidota bacterium]|jgi:PKD repeat protein
MKIQKITFFILLSVCFNSIKAQLWVDKMLDPNSNFYDIKQEFNNYWSTRPYEKGKGYKQFKRWEYLMEPRCYPSGDVKLVSQTYDNFVQWENFYAAAHTTQLPSVMSSTWTPVGPIGAPTNGNAGRINFVRFHPTNTNTIYVGAPDGGLWITTNGGTSWSTNTNQLSVIGCSDIAIDPSNPSTLYLATGDGDAGDSYSVGVFKSTDGGLTWNTTGLTWTVNQARTISRLIIDPTNPQILLAASSVGIWRTSNGGTNWTQTSTTPVNDIEFKPGATATVYATGTRFLKSTNNGASFTQITTGLPANTAVDRMSVAVSVANAAYVYVLAGNATDNGFNGVYRSTNDGASFTTQATTPNLMGWSNNGSDVGGQSWFDQGLAVSPTNANEVLVGGVNVWRSTNGGTSWTIYGHWTGSGAPFIHADIHALEYNSAGTIYAGCDGGIFKRNATTWQDLSIGMNIAQIYRIGLSASATTPNLMITGHQDNGTNRYNGTAWAQVMGGDGMDCFIDRTNNNVMYGEQYNGDLNRSTNGGTNWTSIITGLTGTGAWMTPWHQDPTTANTIYVGYQQLFKSTNQGTNWAQVTGSMTGTSTIVEFAIAPSNNQVIYVIKGNVLFKTTNGGGAWTNITTGLPTTSAAMTNLAVDPSDPNNVWVTFSGYSAANKIFVTTNGGTSWTNISTGLPNIPCNTVCYTPGATNDAIYVGMDVGVYYRDNATNTWSPYFTGLPRCKVSDLEVYSPTGKLRAATFGRSVWEVDLYNPGTAAPVAQFTSNTQVICPGQSISFTDQSSFAPTSWSWTTSPSTGVTINSATSQNPSMTFANAGTYTVTLVATNANGSDSEIKNAYITVTGTQTLPLSEGFASATFPPANWTTKDVNNDAIFWARSTTSGSQGTTESMWFDNYTMDAAGARDEMQCPKYNFSGLTSATLTFDVAYQTYAATTYVDTLAVLVSTDCGATFTQVYMKGGSTLASVTGTNTVSAFAPTTASQWRTETVSLNSFVGQSNVLVVFQNRGRWGQAMYVDNINITGVGGVAPVANFTSATNKCTGSPVQFTDGSTNSPSSWAWTVSPSTGVTITTASSQNPTITFTSPGTYSVALTATNQFGTNINTQTVVVTATPLVVSTSTTICSGNQATLSATGASTYSWNTGATTATTSVNPTATTTYTVTGTTNGCTSTATSTVTVNQTPTVTASSQTMCVGGSATLSASGANSYSWNTGATTSSITVNPSSTSNYTVTGTSNNCTSSITLTVTVVNQPTVTVNSATACAGSPVTLNATGANTYTWSSGQTTSTIVVTPSVTATYSVTGNVGIGCSGNATATVTVNSLPLITASSNVAGDSVCSGNSVILTGGGGSNYAWSGGVNNGVAFVPTSTQTYTVTGTDANGCSNTSIITITVNACLGFESIVDSRGILVYPSPASETLNIRMDQLKGKKVIELLDMNGKITEKITTNALTQTCDVRNYAKGNYIIKISHESKVYQFKFIVE